MTESNATSPPARERQAIAGGNDEPRAFAGIGFALSADGNDVEIFTFTVGDDVDPALVKVAEKALNVVRADLDRVLAQRPDGGAAG